MGEKKHMKRRLDREYRNMGLNSSSSIVRAITSLPHSSMASEKQPTAIRLLIKKTNFFIHIFSLKIYHTAGFEYRLLRWVG
jgi:hypothetical protein